MLCYCKKCGRIVQRLSKQLEEPCDYCNNQLNIVPEKYLGGQSQSFIIKDIKEQFINEYIKSSPEFDQYLFDHRDEDLYNRRVSNQAKMAHGKAVLEEGSRIPKCPTCQSINIKKISGISKAGSVAIWGIFSQKVKHQFKCSNCGYEW